MSLVTRFLLRTENSWLADPVYVDDSTLITTDDPGQAIQFSSYSAAVNRATLIADLFTDITVESAQIPLSVIHERQRRLTVSRKDG